MTVNNSANKVIAAGNGVQTVFGFGFIAVAASDLQAILTDSLGNETVLLPANYTVALNPTPAGQIWAIGGTVTYPLVGSPIPVGSTLTIVRTLSLTQLVSLGNQGNEFPSAVETALDLLEMQLQQVSETFQRAIVAPVVDPTAPLPLPPAAQRANLGMGFDGSGNPVAIAVPASGVISTAMQPVVNAATLALGRTAFGLGAIATEGIGAGLQDDGAGNVRVNSAINEVATNQAIHAASHRNVFAASGALTFTLDRANMLFSGFSFKVYALTGAITFAPNAADNFFGASAGASLIIPKGAVAILTTDALASGVWYADVAGVSPVLNVVRLAAGSGNYTPAANVMAFEVLAQGPGSGGGGGNNSPLSSPGSQSTTFVGAGANLAAGAGTGSSNSVLGAGGAASGGNIFNITGAGAGSGTGTGTSNNGTGGQGGASFFGGAGSGGYGVVGRVASANSGSGGGGGGQLNSTTANAGMGGAAGGTVRHLVAAPAGSYAWVVGVGGTGAAGSSGGAAGAAGADGIILITEYLAFAA